MATHQYPENKKYEGIFDSKHYDTQQVNGICFCEIYPEDVHAKLYIKYTGFFMMGLERELMTNIIKPITRQNYYTNENMPDIVNGFTSGMLMRFKGAIQKQEILFNVKTYDDNILAGEYETKNPYDNGTFILYRSTKNMPIIDEISTAVNMLSRCVIC